MPEQSEGNNHTSKINVFPVLHTIFFLLAGHKVDLFAPHGAIKSTLWPGSRKKYIQLCLQCQLKKLVRVETKNPMIITDTPGTAFDKISMDIVGKLPITSSQNQYILTIQDNFTKYSLAILLPNHQAGTIADAFVKRIYLHIWIAKSGFNRPRSRFSKQLKKFEKQFLGPYEVLEILGEGNIKIAVKNKPKIVNINKLRLSYITPPATNQSKGS